MTAAQPVAYPIMDLLHPDDTMDLASSPHIPAHDLDLPYDLDPMRDTSAEPAQEAMVEDEINPNQHSTADIQLVDEDLLDDDEMVDEDAVVHNADANHEDFTMESGSQALPGAEQEDEDILYEEDEPVQGGHHQAEDVRDVEIVDDEDLFPEDEELPERSLEDTSRISHAVHSSYDEERTYEEQTTNIITQDSEDVGATQGPLFSGESANNISGHSPGDPTHLEDDEAIPRLDHDPPADTVAAGKMMGKESPLGRHETANNNHQASSLRDQAKLDSAGPSVLDEPGGAAVVTAAQFSTRETQYANNGDGESPIHRTEVEDVDEVDHQLHTAPLHTVKVNYQDTEICLFPPNEGDDSETFFLADVDLAHQSLDKLLTACHDVLAGTIGDDDELVLDIPSLGLHIGQDSSYAAQMTLSQILDVYLALCHNEPTEKVEPLYCHLSSRVSLASQHAYLLSAAQQGKAFAEIAAEHLHSLDGSPDQWEEADDVVIERHAENHEDLGQNEKDDDGNPVHENTDFEDTNGGAEQDTLDYHPQEGATTEHIASEEGSHLNALESRPETDDYDVTGDAENETSATSTVRGDELEAQGEYDPLFEICYADGLCYCLDCDANVYADFDISHDDLAESTDMPSIPGNDTEDTGDVTVSIDGTTHDQDGKTETQSAVGDTESSRTIEAGDDTLHPTMNADLDDDDERESFIDSHEDFHDGATPEELEGRATELGDTDGHDPVNSESVDDVDRHGDDQDAAELAATTAASDSNHDNGHLLDVETGGEHDGLFGQEAPVDETSRSAENETSAQGNEQVDILPTPLSEGLDRRARAEYVAIRTTVEEDDLFLGDDDAKASTHEVTAPITPSGTKSSKRRSRDDDDEFGLLESGTPDTKRRRSS